jgi:hypothetical protein
MVSSALAGVTNKRITFFKAVTVNGVTVKPGKYTVRFDSEKNALSIRRYNKVIATAPAHTEKLMRKVQGTRFETAPKDTGDALISVTFNGKGERIVLDPGMSASPSMQ